MKIKLKEDPKEWRKSVLFGALGMATLSSLLRWRRVWSTDAWLTVLSLLALIALAAILFPRWFRGYYRFTSRLAFFLTQFIGQAVLTIIFLVVLTPFGLLLRALGKDPLHLKRPGQVTTYWTPVKESSPLERLF